MKGMLKLAFIALIFASPISALGQSHLSSVWAVDDGEKVRQNDLSYWAKSSAANEVWNGSSIGLFGAKNEIVAFQVILESANTSVDNVTVALDSLVNGGSVITNTGGAGDPTNFVGKHIELFVENYTNVTQRSPFDAGYGLANSRPLPDAAFLGPIPDALVPFEAPVKTPAHGQGGAPFSISAGTNQGVWVDIYIPKNAVAGTYAGVVRVIESGVTTYRIPISLKVYGFALPDETHQRNFFSWSPDLLANRYGITCNTPEYWAMYRKFMNTAHRHRMNLVDGRQNVTNFDTHLGEYYTGTAYTAQNNYDGPGIGTGENTYSIGTYDQPNSGFVSGFYPNTQSAWQTAADQWETWFQNHAPQTLRFKYMDDEGDVNDPAVVQAIKDKCTWIKTSSGPGKNLHRFFTKEFVYQGFYDFIDVWCLSAQPGLRLSDMQARRPSGDLFGSYNGTRPMWGNMELIDVYATDNRVNPWICWKYGVDLLFYWIVAFYGDYVPPNPNGVNAWDNNYIPGGNPYGSVKSWGAGMLFYPGVDIQYPGDSRGVQGPIGCIRMKNFRRGQQDYEYLWLAKQTGIDVSAIVNTIVPHALDDWGDNYTSTANFNQAPTYPQQGYQYENARRTLAQLLDGQAGVDPGAPTATISVTPDVLSAGGGEVTVTWSANGATAVRIDNGIGVVAASGARTVEVSNTTTFTLTAASGSDSVRATTTVNVESGELDTNNVLANASFETGTDPWYEYSNGTATFDIKGPGCDGGLAGHVVIEQPGNNEQLYQYDLVLKPNTEYVLAFAAYSNTGRAMDVSLGEHVAPYTPYGLSSSIVPLQTTWKDYAITFTTKNFTTMVNDGRLRFSFSPYAQSGDEYWIDDVSLREVNTTTTIAAKGASTPVRYGLQQNYPNPFNPTTQLTYGLLESAPVSLKIYDPLGRAVATLVDDEIQSAGLHRVQFDGSRLSSGAYFCRLVTPRSSQTVKMLLVR